MTREQNVEKQRSTYTVHRIQNFARGSIGRGGQKRNESACLYSPFIFFPATSDPRVR